MKAAFLQSLDNEFELLEELQFSHREICYSYEVSKSREKAPDRVREEGFLCLSRQGLHTSDVVWKPVLSANVLVVITFQ